MSIASPTKEAPVQSAATARVEPRLDYMDGIRALAALFVLLHHVWQQVWPTEYGVEPKGMLLKLTGWLFYGHFAVSVFLVVSGFCLMIPVVRRGGELKGGWQLFLKRRARRILPPYFYALAFSLLLITVYVGHKTGTHWDVSLPVTFRGLIAHLLLLQNIFDPNQINHAYWSIAVEYQIYFLFPLLVYCFRRYGAIPSTVAGIAAAYAWYMVSGRLGIHIVAPYYLGLFVVGMLGAECAFGRPGPLDRLPWTVVAGISAAATLLLCHKYTFHNLRTAPIDLIVAVSAASLMVALTRGQAAPIARLLSHRLLVVIGGFSYSLYLIHAPLIQVFWQLIRPMHLAPVSLWLVLTLVFCPVIVAISYAFYYVCERPFVSASHKTIA